MKTITLETIKTEHAKVAEMIALFEAQSMSTTLRLQAIEINLNPGEHYAGLIVGKDGEPSYHLVLMAEAPTDDMNWKTATEWAAHIGGSLPTRREQSLLFANLKDQFEARCYWSGEQHAAVAGFAWYQGFYDGGKCRHPITRELRARAVRRIPISGETK